MKKEYKHDYESPVKKAGRKIKTVFFGLFKDPKKTYPFYASYRHRKVKRSAAAPVTQYMTQEPDYSAGFGHGVDVWRNGIINAALFGLEYAYTPMVNKAWEQELGFSENENSVSELKRSGYRVVKLPYYEPDDEKSISLIKEITASYRGEKVIFLNEHEQNCNNDFFMTGADYMRRKFWAASRREHDKLIYRDGEISVAVHIRRGDVSVGVANGQENMKKRWLSEEYYITVMEKIKEILAGRKMRFYIFSEGVKEDFPLINKMDADICFCLDMGAVDSFIHMCRADLLVVGLSSFSYDPGLINTNLKIASDRFWCPYPDNGEWILADADGRFPEAEEEKIRLGCIG